MLAKIVKELDEKIQVPSDFNAPEARALIGRARVKCGLENATGQFVNQVTKDLETRLADPKKCG